MKLFLSKIILFSVPLILAIYLLMPTFQLMAQDTRAAQPEQTTEPTSPEEIDSSLAGMSDAQVRQAYAQKLKQESVTQTGSKPVQRGKGTYQAVSARFYGAARSWAAVLKRIGKIFAGEQKDAVQWHDIIAKLSEGKGALFLFWSLLGLAVIVALGLAVRHLFKRSTAAIRENLIKAVRLDKLQFLGRVLSRVLLDALGVGIYILATFVAFVLIYREGAPNYIIVSAYLIISYYIMVLAFGARVIFSPQAASLRLFPMEDQDARFLYKWFLRIIFIAGFFAGTSNLFRHFDVSSQLYLLMYGSSGAVVILALMIMIWQIRKRVAQAIWTENTDMGSDDGSLPATSTYSMAK